MNKIIEIPPWGDPIAQGVMPLFTDLNGMLVPVGTAFTTGKIPFFATATHNIEELLKEDPRYAHLVGQTFQGNYDVSNGNGLYVMHQHVKNNELILNLRPIRKSISVFDVTFSSLQNTNDMSTLINPLSFDIPEIGEPVFSVGYADFDFPNEGIEWSKIQDGTFDWRLYNHRLFKIEGIVKRIFTTFSSGFLKGPCFMFSSKIKHAMSGGPIYNTNGYICGVNSAGATMFSEESMSLGSLLYPMLPKSLHFSIDLGPIKMNDIRPMFQLIKQGILKTDDSEERVSFTLDQNNMIAHPRIPVASRAYIHDDFNGFQKNEIGKFQRLKKSGSTAYNEMMIEIIRSRS